MPQGGNTGLVGGQIPDRSGREILLSLGRLDKIREIDPASNTMIVEAGVTLQKVQEAAESVDRLFPLSLASEGSCTIGGNLAANAGGTAVLAYGNARDLVTGLEVVLADGSVLDNLSKLRKDNTGYDLKHVFMGSEGTLGIITAAVVKLYPRPRAVETAFDRPRQPGKMPGAAGSGAEHGRAGSENLRIHVAIRRRDRGQALRRRPRAVGKPACTGMCCWSWPRNRKAASTTR